MTHYLDFLNKEEKPDKIYTDCFINKYTIVVGFIDQNGEEDFFSVRVRDIFDYIQNKQEMTVVDLLFRHEYDAVVKVIAGLDDDTECGYTINLEEFYG